MFKKRFMQFTLLLVLFAAFVTVFYTIIFSLPSLDDFKSYSSNEWQSCEESERVLYTNTLYGNVCFFKMERTSNDEIFCFIRLNSNSDTFVSKNPSFEDLDETEVGDLVRVNYSLLNKESRLYRIHDFENLSIR